MLGPGLRRSLVPGGLEEPQRMRVFEITARSERRGLETAPSADSQPKPRLRDTRELRLNPQPRKTGITPRIPPLGSFLGHWDTGTQHLLP